MQQKGTKLILTLVFNQVLPYQHLYFNHLPYARTSTKSNTKSTKSNMRSRAMLDILEPFFDITLCSELARSEESLSFGGVVGRTGFNLKNRRK